jgi:hypothetical protein
MAKVASSSLVFRSIWHHSQAVRQRSAKSLFSSSILDGASSKALALAGAFSYSVILIPVDKIIEKRYTNLWMITKEVTRASPDKE